MFSYIHVCTLTTKSFTSGKIKEDIERVTYLYRPRDRGVGERTCRCVCLSAGVSHTKIKNEMRTENFYGRFQNRYFAAYPDLKSIVLSCCSALLCEIDSSCLPVNTAVSFIASFPDNSNLECIVTVGTLSHD